MHAAGTRALERRVGQSRPELNSRGPRDGRLMSANPDSTTRNQTDARSVGATEGGRTKPGYAEGGRGGLRCANCGRTNAVPANYCTGCGKPIGLPRPFPAPRAIGATARRQGLPKSPKVSPAQALIAIAVGVIVIALVVAASGLHPSSGGQTPGGTGGGGTNGGGGTGGGGSGGGAGSGGSSPSGCPNGVPDPTSAGRCLYYITASAEDDSGSPAQPTYVRFYQADCGGYLFGSLPTIPTASCFPTISQWTLWWQSADGTSQGSCSGTWDLSTYTGSAVGVSCQGSNGYDT